MPILYFFVMVILFIVILVRLYGYFTGYSFVPNRIVFYLMQHSNKSEKEIRANIGIIYIVIGICGVLIFTFIYSIDIFNIFKINIDIIILSFLGLFACLSIGYILSAIFMSFFYKDMRLKQINIEKEVKKIPWISNILNLPRWSVRIAPIMSAALEELFFRGVLLSILIKVLFIPIWLSILIISILFIFEQLLFVQNKYQAIVIGCSSLSISIVGSSLMIYTGSIVPSIVAHSLFVVFYLKWQ